MSRAQAKAAVTGLSLLHGTPQAVGEPEIVMLNMNRKVDRLKYKLLCSDTKRFRILFHERHTKFVDGGSFVCIYLIEYIECDKQLTEDDHEQLQNRINRMEARLSPRDPVSPEEAGDAEDKE